MCGYLGVCAEVQYLQCIWHHVRLPRTGQIWQLRKLARTKHHLKSSEFRQVQVFSGIQVCKEGPWRVGTTFWSVIAPEGPNRQKGDISITSVQDVPRRTWSNFFLSMRHCQSCTGDLLPAIFPVAHHRFCIPCSNVVNNGSFNLSGCPPSPPRSGRKGTLTTTGHSTNFVMTLMLPILACSPSCSCNQSYRFAFESDCTRTLVINIPQMQRVLPFQFEGAAQLLSKAWTRTQTFRWLSGLNNALRCVKIVEPRPKMSDTL